VGCRNLCSALVPSRCNKSRIPPFNKINQWKERKEAVVKKERAAPRIKRVRDANKAALRANGGDRLFWWQANFEWSLNEEGDQVARLRANL